MRHYIVLIEAMRPHVERDIGQLMEFVGNELRIADDVAKGLPCWSRWRMPA